MKTDPPKPRLAPQGIQRGGASTVDLRDKRAQGPAAKGDRSASKTRLAIATFRSGETLADAIAALELAGFGTDQVGVLGLERGIEALIPIAAKRGGLMSVVIAQNAASDPCLIFTGDGFVLVSCGPLWQKIGAFSNAGADHSKVEIASWMDPATRSDLTQQIVAGAFVLSVHADSVDQQRRGARILLSQSSHGVQTHEFTTH